MRVLVISHNVFSETNNMGKTLLSYFKDFSPEEVAEFYIQDKLPQNATVANRYFRVTDKDALKSVFGKRVGTSFCITQSSPEITPNSQGLSESIRQFGRKRSASAFFMRNTVWSLSHWKTKRLRNWISEFNPDVLFFMSGDYTFMYKIALTIQRWTQKPLVVCCVDDYYLHNRNEKSFFGRILHRSFMRTVKQVMEKSYSILTISDSMGKDYHQLFNKPCYTLHTSAVKNASECNNTGRQVAYFGNLGFRRFEQLVAIGKAIKNIGIDGINCIDVYSSEKNLNNLVGLSEQNGVRFHGEISASEVSVKMKECMAVIHTESFDPEIQKIIKYSVSTKIADSLMNGPCIIAYGPENVASFDYLISNDAAYPILKACDLNKGLQEILTDSNRRKKIVSNARKLAEANHNGEVNSQRFRKWLQMAIDEQ